MGVRNSPELRAAHDSMQPKVVQVFQKVGQSQPLFKVMICSILFTLQAYDNIIDSDSNVYI